MILDIKNYKGEIYDIPQLGFDIKGQKEINVEKTKKNEMKEIKEKEKLIKSENGELEDDKMLKIERNNKESKDEKVKREENNSKINNEREL